MTRRERHMNIIHNMGPQRSNYAIADLLARKERWSLFSDEGIERLAAYLVDELKWERRNNEHNRKLRIAK